MSDVVEINANYELRHNLSMGVFQMKMALMPPEMRKAIRNKVQRKYRARKSVRLKENAQVKVRRLKKKTEKVAEEAKEADAIEKEKAKEIGKKLAARCCH